mmetsp:Transcript_16783/g.44014  ORF Transcript_16783/g.44014 Transcript_16783/m.44014 type:complete len:239 (-) Transcript_16783:296-1012(-)
MTVKGPSVVCHSTVLTGSRSPSMYHSTATVRISFASSVTTLCDEACKRPFVRMGRGAPPSTNTSLGARSAARHCWVLEPKDDTVTFSPDRETAETAVSATPSTSRSPSPTAKHLFVLDEASCNATWTSPKMRGFEVRFSSCARPGLLANAFVRASFLASSFWEATRAALTTDSGAWSLQFVPLSTNAAGSTSVGATYDGHCSPFVKPAAALDAVSTSNTTSPSLTRAPDSAKASSTAS